jgi:hypothetical protein
LGYSSPTPLVGEALHHGESNLAAYIEEEGTCDKAIAHQVLYSPCINGVKLLAVGLHPTLPEPSTNRGFVVRIADSIAMDAASAITSLISFSIQSAKIIYQVLQTLNAGQDKVAHSVAIKTNKLRADLERFEKSPAGRTYNDPELEELMKDCHAVLEGMRNKLQKFKLTPGDHLPVRLWKAFRAATSDAELKKFQANLESYSIQLTIHLGISTKYVTPVILGPI